MAPSQERRKKTKKEKRELVLRMFRNHGKEDKKDGKESYQQEQKTAPISGKTKKADSNSSKPAVQVETDQDLAHTVFEKITANSKPAVVNEKQSKLKWKGGSAAQSEKDTEAAKTADATMSAKDTEDSNKNNDDAENQPTIFEEVDGPRRPAVVYEKPAALQWKKPTPEPTEKTTDNTNDGEPGQFEQAADPNAQAGSSPNKQKGPVKDVNFMIACKLMIQIRQCNIMETILMDSENAILKKFFEEQMENPTNTVIELLHKSIDLCYEKIVFHGDQYDIYLDADTYIFIKNKDLAKSKCLDVLMKVPDCLPLRWGGKNVGMQLCEDIEDAAKIVNQANDEVKQSKSKMAAPTEGENEWTPMLKEVADDKNTKENEPTAENNISDPDKPKPKKVRKKRILDISAREEASARREMEMREERDRLIAANKEAEQALRPMVAPPPVSIPPPTPTPNKKQTPPLGVVHTTPKNKQKKEDTAGQQSAPIKLTKTQQEQEAQRKGLANYFKAPPPKALKKK